VRSLDLVGTSGNGGPGSLRSLAAPAGWDRYALQGFVVCIWSA